MIPELLATNVKLIHVPRQMKRALKRWATVIATEIPNQPTQVYNIFGASKLESKDGKL